MSNSPFDRFLRRAQMLDQIRDRANRPHERRWTSGKQTSGKQTPGKQSSGRPTTPAEREFEHATRIEQEIMRRVMARLRGERTLH